jgi:preprotein translocase subunit SecD
MTEDFIARLERQLEAAELRELNRGRALRRVVGAGRLLSVPLAAAATIAVAALVVVVALQGLGREDALDPGSVHETLSYRVLHGDAEHAAQVLRARFAAAGVPATTVSVPARDRLTISAPAAARADVTALTRPGVLEIYDYEGDGPAESLAAPTTRADAEANAAYSNGRLVQDQRGGDRWYAFFGRPALTNRDLASASSGVDERTGEPIVQIEFTQRGQRAFEALTRGIAHRGRRNVQPHPGEHFVIVLDGRIVAPPQAVNPKVTPDGLDGSRGVQINGGLTSQSARRIAAMLNAWPMTPMVRTDEAGGG